MADPPRILHLADSHIGADLPARRRRPGRRRGDDLIDSYRTALGRAREFEVDLIIHAGDVFDSPRPNTAALNAAAEPLLDLAASGIPIVIVPGNHERSVLPASLLFSHHDIHIIAEPRTLTFELNGVRVAVAAFPCVRRNVAGTFSDQLAAAGWRPGEADIDILAIHQTVESATCGPGNYRFRSGDDVIDRDAIPAEFDYVAAGHVHRHQVLRRRRLDGPTIVYAGSTDRVSLAEKDEPKGCMLLSLDGGGLSHRFIEHRVRPMAVVALDVTGRTRARLRDEAADAVRSLPDDAVASLRLTGHAGAEGLRGLGLTRLARELRPDALVGISSADVEFDATGGAAVVRKATDSIFDQLDVPKVRIIRRTAGRARFLPARRGTYALFDDEGRLLYAGKATNARSRVQTHLRDAGAAKFHGWSRRIDGVEFRPADGELEALLIEAELIRRLRPPFNQQMRRWSRYCYLCESAASGDRLDILGEPLPGVRCFGPFSSRRCASAVAEAIDVLSAVPGANGRIELRDALLGGIDASGLHRLLPPVNGAGAAPQSGPVARAVSTLTAAFERLSAIRRAESLIGDALILPSTAGARLVAVLLPHGVRMERVDRVNLMDRMDGADANIGRRLDRHHGLFEGLEPTAPRRFDKSMVDCGCIALRHLEQHPERHERIRRGSQPSQRPSASSRIRLP